MNASLIRSPSNWFGIKTVDLMEGRHSLFYKKIVRI
jgi:hypothetical protein